MADSIYALATSPGRGAVAMVRVSGPAAGPALLALAGRLAEPRVAMLMTLRRPGDGAVLDKALVLRFPGPDSYTGEDVVEFHVHGGHPLGRLKVRIHVQLFRVQQQFQHDLIIGRHGVDRLQDEFDLLAGRNLELAP